MFQIPVKTYYDVNLKNPDKQNPRENKKTTIVVYKTLLKVTTIEKGVSSIKIYILNHLFQYSKT